MTPVYPWLCLFQVTFLITLSSNYNRIKISRELTEYRHAADLEMTDTTVLEPSRKAYWGVAMVTQDTDIKVHPNWNVRTIVATCCTWIPVWWWLCGSYQNCLPCTGVGRPPVCDFSDTKHSRQTIRISTSKWPLLHCPQGGAPSHSTFLQFYCTTVAWVSESYDDL